MGTLSKLEISNLKIQKFTELECPFSKFCRLINVYNWPHLLGKKFAKETIYNIWGRYEKYSLVLLSHGFTDQSAVWFQFGKI